MRRGSAIDKGRTAIRSPLCLGRPVLPQFGTATVAIAGVATGFSLAFVIFIAWIFSIDA